MKREDFWNLIDETNQLCPTHDQESIMAVATDKLLKLSVKDILDFHMIQQEYLGAAYRNALPAASEAMAATPSYDGLQAFIYWLISRGKEVFINAVNDPDTLADVPKAGEKIEFRSFGFAAYTAYSMKMDRIDPENMSDIYSALNSLDYDGLAPETWEAIHIDFGYVWAEQGQGEPRWLDKWQAVMELEDCHRLDYALDLAQNLRCYNFLPRDMELADYGKMLAKQDGIYPTDELLVSCFDAEGYANQKMRNLGLSAAEHGYVSWNGIEILYEYSQPPNNPTMSM